MAPVEALPQATADEGLLNSEVLQLCETQTSSCPESHV